MFFGTLSLSVQFGFTVKNRWIDFDFQELCWVDNQIIQLFVKELVWVVGFDVWHLWFDAGCARPVLIPIVEKFGHWAGAATHEKNL